MSTPRRTQKMSSLIRAELARVLTQEISDPSLSDLTITEVELTNDLKLARVYFTSSAPEVSPKKEKEIGRGFHRAAPYFRRKIGENLEVRYVPELEFIRDKHGESVNRLMHLMDEVGPGHGEPK